LNQARANSKNIDDENSQIKCMREMGKGNNPPQEEVEEKQE